jgi:hypothetical protein
MAEKSNPLYTAIEVQAAKQTDIYHHASLPQQQPQTSRHRRGLFVLTTTPLLLLTAAILTYTAYHFALFISACNNSGNIGDVVVVDQGFATTGTLRKRSDLGEGQMAVIAGCVLFFLLVVVGASVWMLQSRRGGREEETGERGRV